MRIFCIGRNYAAHAAELGNEIPSEPVVFIKPSSCLVMDGAEIIFPDHGSDLHHEAEIVVELGEDCSHVSENAVPKLISRIGLGLDLTLRDVQSKLKEKGLPWEKAKAFDYSSPLGKMIEYSGQDLNDLHIGCSVNGVERQNASTSLMLFPITQIVSYLSTIWALKKGDLIYTGTPKGVGPLKGGDSIEVFSKDIGSSTWSIK
ncbi:MAG: fumarylacetoacetate hydrolase family protein [Lentisphaeraceae bacterium]|nr:fumarylacetoacetate hydrolase family protein [Lentisphaeraceae bacterium]